MMWLNILKVRIFAVKTKKQFLTSHNRLIILRHDFCNKYEKGGPQNE